METGYGRASRLWGWAIVPVSFVHSLIQITMPRTAKTLPLRDELRNWHYVVGLTLLILVTLRLRAWAREPAPRPPAGMSPAAWHWGRMLALTSYIALFLAPFLGVIYGWSSSEIVFRIGEFVLPNPIGENRTLWMFSGYFHSGLGFMMLALNLSAALTLIYTLFVYGRGALSALPPGFGAMVLIGLGFTTYAFNTFRAPPAAGFRAVAVYAAVVLALWGIAVLTRRTSRAANRAGPGSAGLHSRPLPGWARTAAPAAAAGVLALGAYGPFGMFGVTPWPMGVVIEAPANIQSHMTLVTKVSIAPPTPFEEKVRDETYKWCGFCHNLTKADRGKNPKVGPNLWGIFGQKAATVPNFHYTEALAGARDRGLVWNDQTIAQYIADPHKFVPGTTMVISSGPIPDPKVQAAVVNLLKRDTMVE